MNVVHIIARLNVGGPAFELQALQAEFPKLGVNSTIIAGYCEHDEKEFLDLNLIAGPIYRVASLKRRISPISDFKSFLTLRKLLIDLKPDIVHTHTSKAGLLGRVAAITIAPRPGIVHSFHGHVFEGYFREPSVFLILRIERILAHFTNLILCVGSKTKEEVVLRKVAPAEKVAVVPTARLIERGPSKGRVRSNLRIGMTQIVVAYVGRLAPIKRIDRLVEVIRLLESERHITWLILGDGQDRKLIESAKRTFDVDIRFLGWKNDLHNFLPCVDIAVLVSDNEGTPLSIVDAGYFGVPTVSTKVGSVSDLIQDSFNGLLVKPTAPDIAGAIKSLVKNQDKLRFLSSNARSFFRENFSPKKSASLHLKYYRQIKES